jgi:hypothetical protein
MGSLRDFWLLLTVGALAGATLIPLAAHVWAQPSDLPPERVACIEEWDQDQEWLPHVSCHQLLLFEDPPQGMLARPTPKPLP